MTQDWETECPNREDKKHCECWYDGHPCCSCPDPGCPHDFDEEGDCRKCAMPRWWAKNHVPCGQLSNIIPGIKK